MAPRPHADITGSTAACPVTPGTEAGEFVDLLVADDEWVRREFDAIVAAGWGDVYPPCPASRQGAQWPRRPGSDVRPAPVHALSALLLGTDAEAHQRGPPL